MSGSEIVERFTLRQGETEINWHGGYRPFRTTPEGLTEDGQTIETLGYALIDVLARGEVIKDGEWHPLRIGTYVLLGEHGFYALTDPTAS